MTDKDTKARQYRERWEAKPTKQVERELKSWQAHFEKHEGHYSFHGSTSHPSELSDGNRVGILKDILSERDGQSD